MHSDAWLAANTKKLADAGVSSARLDCLILLEDESGRDRAWLLAHPEYALPAAAIDDLDKKIARRAVHEPLAYIRGKTEFYGREFYVDSHVLEPRPESETMIMLLSSLSLPAGATVIDVGTGSGALAISAKLEVSDTEVYATDIDPHCLHIARRNAEALGADIAFARADLLESATGSLPVPDVILANLPYVPDNYEINLAAGHEPRLAIFGGPDGLDLYRRLFGAFADMPTRRRPSFILTEALPPQHESLARITRDNGYRTHVADGFIQVFVAA